ncbi:hypothetical protein DC432_11340 [Microbacterium testaceum]|uniref:Uncharacterized protein n=1 Tax=Microbacterium testaceum TaxID=2033 RepID=A0A2T7WE72_MICTE|nr:hypothetical protein DC432_11340 [Microbacterium testaceum]
MRWVSFTDRYGAQDRDDIALDRLAELLATIAVFDGDDEHRSISVSDSDAWNLEFYPDWLLFENVEVGGGEVGRLRGLSDKERLEIADEFIRGDFDALRARPWGS